MSMNIHQLYENEKANATKVHYNHGGRGEFYGGDQIYTTGFKDSVVPFSGRANKLSDNLPESKPPDQLPTNSSPKPIKHKRCRRCIFSWFKSCIKE